MVRRPPVQPPASPRVARRNSSTRGGNIGSGSEHNTVTQPPSRSSIPVPVNTSNNTNEVSDSSSCNSDVSHPNPNPPSSSVLNSSEVSSTSGCTTTKNNGHHNTTTMQENNSSKILQLGNGTSTLANSSPTKSLTSITSLPKMKDGGGGPNNKQETETTVVGAPIATLESTCEDLQVEVKNGGDLMVVTAHALAEMTANSDAMTAGQAVSPTTTTTTSTCMNEAASPACV